MVSVKFELVQEPPIMDIFVELIAEGLINTGINGPTVLLHLAVVSSKRVLSEIAEDLCNDKVWHVKKMGGLTGSHCIYEDTNPFSGLAKSSIRGM